MLSLLGWAAALAQAPVPVEPARLPEVTVSATRVESRSFDLPASIDTITAQQIREAGPGVDLSEAAARIPGLVVRKRENYAQDLQISSRGFGSRASFGVRGLRLIADGIPASMPDGQGQAASFDLDTAERIEVLRGPFASIYGNAAGGLIQVFTADGPDEPTLTGRAYAGSYGTRKFGLQFGSTRGAMNYLAGVSRFMTDGYRDHSAARRDQANAKLTVETPDRGTMTVIASALDEPETLDPRGLTAAQVAASRRQAGDNALAFNTRKSVAQYQGGLTYKLPIASRNELEARVYGGDRQVTQYLGIPLFAQTAPTASGGVVDLDRQFGGAGLRLTHRTEGTAPATLIAGTDYERMSERRRGFINDFGVAGALKRDEDNTVTSTAFYGQGEWELTPKWSFLAGVRYTRVAFDTRDFFIAPGNPDDTGSADFSRTTPAVGAVYRLTPTVNLYANYGKGFETPTFAELAYRPDGSTGLNLALRPARSTHRELGAKALIGAAGKINVALFRIDVEDEIVVDSSSGGRTTFRNAAATRREGFELAWENRFERGFEAALAYTWLDARFEQPFTSGSPPTTVPAGNRLPAVPEHTAFAELIWRDRATGFYAGVDARYSDKVFVDDANSESAGAYLVWNVSAGFRQQGRGWRIEEFIRIDNVANRRYIGAVIVEEANGRFYEPAAERKLLVGVQAAITF